MRWTILSCPPKHLAKFSSLGNQQLSCLRLLPFIILSICNHFLRRFQLHFPMVPYPLIIPPCSFLNTLCPIQDPSPLIMLIENPLRSRLWWHTRLKTLCGGTPVTNKICLSDYAGQEALPKVVLLFPGSGIPSLDLGGSKSQFQQTGTIAEDELEDPP